MSEIKFNFYLSQLKNELILLRFVQVFLENPFLVDGHAFDVGVYVLITSLEPLTIYRFKSECLFRFCPEPYHPFDTKNTKKYVVGNDRLHSWEMPAFKNLIGQFSHKQIFENYFNSKGFDVKNLWRKIDDAIVLTILQMHKFMLKELKKECKIYNCTNENFFELVRFDFMIKNDGNVQIMEVNMSPNLTPDDAKYEQNANMHEQIVYNTLRLIGAEGFGLFKDEIE